MMTDAEKLALAVLAGSTLGMLFFGGLWWTVRRGLTSEQPALWFFASLLIRTAMIVVGFLIVSRGHVNRLLACLLGFLVVRLLAARIALPPSSLRHLPSEAADAT